MAKTNYTFEKRQKELAKKQKKEAKLLKKSLPSAAQDNGQLETFQPVVVDAVDK